MVFSTGSGGSVGGSPTPTHRETETTAATEVGKMVLGIVQDSLEIPFSQIGLQNTWKYNSTASNPSIPTLNQMRMVLSFAKGPNTEWTGTFAELMDLLPKDVKERLLNESKLPFEQRDETYGKLDNFLGLMAKGLSWMRGVSTPQDPEKAALTHDKTYKSLPFNAKKGLEPTVSDILKGADGYLEQLATGSQHFDELLKAVNNAKEALGTFEGRWLLKVVNGPNNGAEFPMQAGENYIIGSNPDTCDIVFSDERVSKQHARIQVTKDDHLLIEDLKSQQGTKINSVLIETQVPLPLNTIITLGSSSFEIYDREGK
jgi:hypothetical protein